MNQLEASKRGGADADAAGPAAVAVANAPDWNAIRRDVQCPLCGYNLRGLAEPRCPECGYGFAWADVLREDRPRHPYLFESHPEANVRSFVRTMLGGLLPRRFWRLLTPVEPARPGRLVTYWFLALTLILASLLALLTPEAITVARLNDLDRTRAAGWLRGTPSNPFPSNWQNAEIQRQINLVFPPTWGLTFLREKILPLWFRNDLVRTAVIIAAWPVATLATLMIFRASMRRAKVKTFHVLRCVLYSCDAGLLLGLPIYLLLHAVGHHAYVDRDQLALIMIAAVIAPYTAYRLACAYELYLNFDRPWATALSSQLIVWLVVAVLALNT